MTFSIIVVCLNAGEKLHETVESILNQTEQDYEIIVKDGESTDETTVKYLNSYAKNYGTMASGLAAGYGQTQNAEPEESTESAAKIRVYRCKDKGIYDAMNQAVQYVRGKYVLFLNCGDSFYDEHVLEQVRKMSRERTRKQTRDQFNQTGHTDDNGITASSERSLNRYILYGDIYERLTDTLVQSNPVIDDFACYRNVPCHQACFYDASLLRDKGFDTAYAVRADYEHFLWCYYRARAKTLYLPVTVAWYEGGGFSETRENERRSRREHREIVHRYMPAGKVFRYRLIMAVTLAPLRTWIARNPVTAGVYQGIKRKLYRR